MFLTGLGVFTVASGVGAGRQRGLVVRGQGRSGIGAAMLSPAALSIITTQFEGPDRTRALGVWGAVGGARAAVGVLVGGVLTELIDWRAIFLINLPIGLIVGAGSCTRPPRTSGGHAGDRSICAARSGNAELRRARVRAVPGAVGGLDLDADPRMIAAGLVGLVVFAVSKPAPRSRCSGFRGSPTARSAVALC